MDERQTTGLTERIEKEGVYAGFGLVYEKLVFSEVASRLIKDLGLRTVCEYPANNLMGNNSDVFRGCEIVRLKGGVKESMKFDLVWNFCEFEQADDPDKLIEQCVELSAKYLFIVTQNIRNPGVLIHRLYHLLKRRRWDHGKIARMSYNAVRSNLNGRRLEILATGAFDAPWFIFDVYESGKFLRKLIFNVGTNDENLRESFFEKSPMWIRSWLAHHHYVLLTKT